MNLLTRQFEYRLLCSVYISRTLVVFAGVDLVEMPVLLRRWKVLNRVEVELGFKII